MFRGLGANPFGAGTDAVIPRGSRTAAQVHLKTSTVDTIRRKSRALTQTQATAKTMASPIQQEAVSRGGIVETLAITHPDVVTTPASPAAQRCGCLFAKMAEAAELDPATLPPEMAAGFVANCVQNEAEMFKAQAGVGVKVDGCRVWYMRRTTWMIGGAVGAGLLAFKLLR